MKVGVLFGGRSVEHEISIMSAAAVCAALAQKNHECICIGIDREGQWYLMDQVAAPSSANSRGLLTLRPGGGGLQGVCLLEGGVPVPLDVVFPVLHGEHGEDGRIQGALDSCCLKYIGAGVAASAVTNDKDLTKRLLREAGIATASHLAYYKDSQLAQAWRAADQAQLVQEYRQLQEQLGLPFWIKPADLGSSLGITKVTSLSEFSEGLTAAFALTSKIIIEEHLAGRELECAVLAAGSSFIVSSPGEILLEGCSFYDYAAKYSQDSPVSLVVPTEVSPAIRAELETLATRVFSLFEQRHIMRLDLFLVGTKLWLNEIQTIPGFTSISMYPKLLTSEGLPLPELVDRLVTSAYYAAA